MGKFFHKIVGKKKIELKNLASTLVEESPELNQENIEARPFVSSVNGAGSNSGNRRKLPSFFNRNMFWLFAGIASLVVFVFLGGKLVLQNRNAPTEKAPEVVTPAGVIVSGKVATSSKLAVNPGVNGTVSGVYVKKGDKVKEGQKIADLTPDQEDREKSSEALSEYLAAKKSLETAQEVENSLREQYLAAHKRFMEGAVASNLPTGDPTYMQQKAEMDSAENELKKQQTKVLSLRSTVSKLWQAYEQGLLSISSPAEGTISELSLVEGEAIPKTAVIINTNDDTTLVFNIGEGDFAKIQTNDRAEVALEAFENKVFSGTVRKIEGRMLTVVLADHEEAIAIDTPASARILTD